MYSIDTRIEATPGILPAATSRFVSNCHITKPHVSIAHAATAWDGSDLLATGGRVMSVIATGPTFAAARESAYATLESITLEGSHYRRDIALRVTS